VVPADLITGASTSAAVAQAEIFGPVLVAMSFRTPAEAVQLANNTVYGLAACVWTESISLALDVAPQIKAGVVWINTANQFDAACGFGGYKESGFGREGGKEGMYEYLTPLAEDARPAAPVVRKACEVEGGGRGRSVRRRPHRQAVHRRQAGPPGRRLQPRDPRRGRQLPGRSRRGQPQGHPQRRRSRAQGHRLDQGHRAQPRAGAVLHRRKPGRARRRIRRPHRRADRREERRAEVQASIERLFYWAAWADKHDGLAHQPPMHGITVALNEPVGVIGIVCPNENPLLGFISLVAPALALGNRVIAVPSEAHPLSALDLYQVLDTSDLPGGALNIVTGSADELARTLASHFDVDAVWRHDGSAEGCAEVERCRPSR
jgi:aldehyde dehydrogenase (NAD+)